MKRNHEIEIGEISQYFPHFIWLLRDVSLITSDDGEGGEMDPTDYIKKKVFHLLFNIRPTTHYSSYKNPRENSLGRHLNPSENFPIE